MSVSDFINTPVTVIKAGATTDLGVKDDSGATVVVNARVEQVNKLNVATQGHESNVEALLIMEPDANIGREDRVVLDGEEMLVLNIGKERHGDGSIHHLEVAVGKKVG